MNFAVCKSFSSSLPTPVFSKNPGTLEHWNKIKKSCYESMLCGVPDKPHFCSEFRQIISSRGREALNKVSLVRETLNKLDKIKNG